MPVGPLRIGYQHNPPFQVRSEAGQPGGLAVETVAEAARRAGYTPVWMEVPEGPDRVLETAAVDLWPLVTDLPERRAKFHITAPWLQSQHVLVVRGGRELPGPELAEPVAVTAVAVHVRLLREAYPRARAVDQPSPRARSRAPS